MTALPAFLPRHENLGKTFVTVVPGALGTWDIKLTDLTLESGFPSEDAALLRASSYISYRSQLVDGVAERVEWILTHSSASSEMNACRIRALNNARRQEVGRNLGRGAHIVTFCHFGFWWETIVRIERDDAGFLTEETTDEWLLSVSGDSGAWLSADALVAAMNHQEYAELAWVAVKAAKENLP